MIAFDKRGVKGCVLHQMEMVRGNCLTNEASISDQTSTEVC